jgi:hypothetical protein
VVGQGYHPKNRHVIVVMRSNCVILHRKLAFARPDDVDTFHSSMFHGTVDHRFPVADNHLGTTLATHLHLKKNVFDLASVIKPHRNLVVSSAIKDRLAVFQNVGFWEVVFTALYYIPYRPGDWSGIPEDYDDQVVWLDQMQNDPSLERKVSKYFELVVPQHSSVATRFTSPVPHHFTSLTYKTAVALDLSREMLNEYPAIWTAEGILMSEMFFRTIEDSINRRYFKMAAIELLV